MTRATTTDLPSVDVRAVLRAVRGGRGGPRDRRARRAPSLGVWTATGFQGWRMVGGELSWRVATVRVEGVSGVLTVSVHEAPSPERVHQIALDGEPMPLGGARWWARCPGCSGRCAVVYFARGVVRCRRCFGLAYRCQRMPAYRRAGLRIAKLADRLRARELLGEPTRPPRMRRATFARLLASWRDFEAREMASLPIRWARWLR